MNRPHRPRTVNKVIPRLAIHCPVVELDQDGLLRMENDMLKHDVRILLVEDHPFQLTATQCLLNSYGFHQLTPAHNAESALRLMQQAQMPFEILLCDQCLPDLLGLELI